MSKLREMREKILSKKDNKGFTLVELIVVIVILAILVGVTIGGVYGYVNKSRVNTDINNASAITSTLSTMTTIKDFSGSTFKPASGSTTKTATITWGETAVTKAQLETETGDSTKGITFTAVQNVKDHSIGKKIAELLPDGLPAAKTAGATFELKMTWDDKGNFQSVKCTALDSDGSTPLEAQE